MKILTSLLFVGLAGTVGAFFLTSLEEPDEQNADHDDDLLHLQAEDLKDLKAYYDTLTKDTLRAIRQAERIPSSDEGTRRGKRSLLHGPPMIDEHGVHHLRNVEPLFPMCRHAINIKFLDFKNETYAVCVSATTKITLGKVSGHGWQPVASWEVRQPRQAAMFADRGFIYIVASDADNPDGTDLLVYSKETDHVLLDHTIHSRQATAIAVWMMEHEGAYHLAVANSPGPESEEFHDSTYLYEWKGTYFDKYSSFRSYDVHDLEAFHIHSNVFLAVANHRVSIYNYHIDSEIFKYDINRKKWKSFQRIRTYAASDWEFFSLGQNNNQEFFLAVANQFDLVHGYRKYDVNSVIYKYVENKFVPYQCLLTSGATQIAALKGPKQEFILAVSNYYEAVQLYQYNGWRFVLSSVQYTQGSMGPGAVSLAAHYLHDSRIVLAVSNPVLEQDVNLYALSFQHENTLQNWYRQSVSWCKSAKHKADSIPTPIVLKNLSSLPLIDQDEPIHLPGGLIFDRDASLRGSLHTPQLKDMATSSVFDHSVLNHLWSLNQRLQNINGKIREMKNYLLRALRLSGDQLVTGAYDFHSADFTCEAADGCEVSSIYTNYLNGDNVEGLAHSIVLINAPNDITIPMEFQNVRARDVTVGGLLSGINTSHIITRSGNHFLKSPTTFSSPVVAENVIISGLANGVRLDGDNLLLDHGDQFVNGDLVFDNVATENLQVEQRLNNILLNDFYHDVVLKGEKEFVRGPMVIEADVTVDNMMMHPGAKINGVDLADLWNNVMWEDGFQEVYAPLNMSGLHVDELVASAINGLAIPGPEVILLSSPADIKGPKTFQKTSSIRNLDVLGSLNDIKIIHDPHAGWHNQLDIMVKSFPQTVFGRKIFPSLHLDGHSSFLGSFGGVDIRQLAENIVKLNATQEFSGTWIFDKAEFRGPLEVMGANEGWDLAKMFHDALKLSQPLPSHSTVIFKGLAQMERLNSPDVNGVDVSRDLVTKKGNQVLRGVKTLTDVFLVGNSVLHGLVNGINLAFLHDSMLTHGDQVFMDGKQIANNLIISNMKVGGLVNGIPLENLVSLNRDEVLVGVNKLQNPHVRNLLRTLSLEFTGLINNVTFQDIVQNTMTYSGHQDVYGHITVLGNLTLVDGSNLETPNMNGIDLKTMAADVVFHDQPQMITGKKTFTNLVHFDHLIFLGSLDGVTSWDMMYNWMIQDVPQTINGDFIVNGDVFVNSYMLSGLVNGLDMVHLKKTVAQVNEPMQLSGPIHIKNAAIEKNLNLAGKVQGLDLSEEAVLKSRDNTIWGHKHFVQGITVGGNLFVKGYIDGLKVSEMCQHTIHSNGVQHLKSVVVNGDLEIKGGLNVGGLLDGVDLVLLNATTIKLDEAINNGHPFTFDTLEVMGPLTVDGTLNGMDMLHLMNFYMSLSRDQQVDASLVFHAPVTVKGPFSVGDLTTADSRINGIDINSLSTSVLRTEGDQMIQMRYVFENGLRFSKDFHAMKFGGLAIPDDLMMKGRENFVSGPIAFSQIVNIHGDLNLKEGALLKNIDVVDWARNAVYKHGNFNITGAKGFESCVIDDARFHNSLNGVKISPDSVLLSHGNQELHGNTLFKKNVQTLDNVYVGGLVNGMDLEKFQRDAVTRNGDNVILGVKSFLAPVSMAEMMVHGTVDGVNLTALNRKFGDNILNGIKHQIHDLDGQLAGIEERLKEQATSFFYYELLQEMKQLRVQKWHFFPIQNNDFLFVSDARKDTSGCTLVHVLKYSSSGQFSPYTAQPTLHASQAVDMASAVTKDNAWLFVGNANPVSCIHRQLGALYVYRWNSNGYDLVQVLEELPIRNLAAVILNGYACVVAHTHTSNEANPLHVYCNEGNGFRFVQNLQSSSVREITSSVCRNAQLLAVATEYSTDVYTWNGQPSEVELKLQQKIPGSASVVSCTSDTLQCFMALATKNLLSIYSFEEAMHKYVLIQKWELDNVILNIQWALLPSSVPQHLLLVLTRSSQGNLHIFRLQGASGFVLYHKLDILDATDIYTFPQTGSIEHYLALISESCSNDFWHPASPQGYILKAKIKGGPHHS